ncbi:hypothetical protein C5S35_05630, partial [Candidatus Methanophagaceae archaeon]
FWDEATFMESFFNIKIISIERLPRE